MIIYKIYLPLHNLFKPWVKIKLMFKCTHSKQNRDLSSFEIVHGILSTVTQYRNLSYLQISIDNNLQELSPPPPPNLEKKVFFFFLK